ncbi:MAG: GAF domain-containing protein [Microcoleaceae cyanobacterium]
MFSSVFLGLFGIFFLFRWVRQRSQSQALRNIDVAHYPTYAATEFMTTEAVLQHLLAKTASVTGEDFFRILVEQLGIVLGVSYVGLAEVINTEPLILQRRAAWSEGQHQASIELDARGLPCEWVVRTRMVQSISDDLQTKFPRLVEFREINPEFYLGVPLLDSNQQQPMGVIHLLGQLPLNPSIDVETVLTVFATRATAELQRLKAEAALQKAHHELAIRVEDATRTLRQQASDLEAANVALEREIQERVDAEFSLLTSGIRLKKQQGGLIELAQIHQIYDGNLTEALKEIARVAGRTLNVKRVSIWLHNHKADQMQRVHCHDCEENCVELLSESLSQADCPRYFRSLERERVIAVTDVQTDLRTQELNRIYWMPASVTSALIVPIRFNGKTQGSIWLEQTDFSREWVLEEQNFASYLAYMTALAMESCDHKQAEEALRESQLWVQRITDASPGVLYLYNLETNRNLYINNTIVDILGYTAEEIQAMPQTLFQALLHPEDLARIEDYYTQMSIGYEGDVFEIEYRMRHRNGHWLWFVSRDTVFAKTASGAPEQILGTASDITEIKQAESALKASEAFLNQVINAMADPIYVKDQHLNWTMVNDAFCELVGRSHQSLIGLSSTETLSSTQAEALGNHDEYILAVGTEVEQEETLTDAHGEARTLITKKIGFTDLMGNPALVGIVHDITDRKRTEQTLRQQVQISALRADIGVALTKAESLHTILHQCVAALCEDLDALSVCIWTLNPGKQSLELQASDGLDLRDSTLCYINDPSQDARINWILRHHQPYLSHKHWPPFADSEPDMEQREMSVDAVSLAGYPLMIREQLLGVVAIFSQTPLPEMVLEEMTAIASSIALGIDRKQAEEKLRASQTSLATAQRVAHVGNWEWDVETQTLVWSEELFRIFGWEPSQSVPTYSELLRQIHPEDRELWRRNVRRVADEGSCAEFDCRVIQLDGSIRHVEARGEGIYDSQGQIIRALGTALDITERKRSEEALRQMAEREQAFSLILQQMRQSLDLDIIFNSTVEELRVAAKSDRAVIYRFNPDWSGEFVAESVTPGWVSLMEQNQDSIVNQQAIDSDDCVVQQLSRTENHLEDTYLQETQGGAYRQGAAYLCVHDVHQADFASCYVQLLEKFQAKAYVTVPIFCGQQLWGLLAIYQYS